MTSSDVEGHAPVPSILKCRLSYTCGVVDKISADSALHGPSVITELLVAYHFVDYFRLLP